MAATWVGGAAGPQGEVALAVGVAGFFSNVFTGAIALRVLGRRATELWGMLRMPLCLALGFMVVGFATTSMFSSSGPVWRRCVVGLALGGFFSCATWALVPEVRRLSDYRRGPIKRFLRRDLTA